MATPTPAAEKPKVPKAAVTVKDVAADRFVVAYAAHLKKSGKFELPKWVDVVKTGKHKELAPYNPDWFYIRAASIARRIYLHGGIGIGAFKKIYGASQRRGSRPARFSTASGSVVRHALKQLTKIKVVEIDQKGGRRLTTIGQRDLDRIAGKVARQ